MGPPDLDTLDMQVATLQRYSVVVGANLGRRCFSHKLLLDRLCRTLYLSVDAEAFYFSLKTGSA